jgi:ABC-type phosphate/phosphonate transport system ATPase subunit
MLDKGQVVFDKPSKDTTEEELLAIYKAKLNEQIA